MREKTGALKSSLGISSNTCVLTMLYPRWAYAECKEEHELADASDTLMPSSSTFLCCTNDLNNLKSKAAMPNSLLIVFFIALIVFVVSNSISLIYLSSFDYFRTFMIFFELLIE